MPIDSSYLPSYFRQSSSNGSKDFDEWGQTRSSEFEAVNPLASGHGGYHPDRGATEEPSRLAAPSQSSLPNVKNQPLPNQPFQGGELEMQEMGRQSSVLSSELRDTESSIPKVLNFGRSSRRSSSSSSGHSAMENELRTTQDSGSQCCPPPYCSYYYNHPNLCKRYSCRGCLWFWFIYIIFLAWSILDLLPLILEENPDNLYMLNFVAINDVCDASSIPYDVDVDFTLPFHGELAHVNEIEFTVFKNDNPDKIPGHVDKSEVVSSSFQPLWDGSKILRGGDSKMAFSSSAVLRSLERAGELATNMMNEYDFQSIVSLKVPIFTARLMFPIWYTAEMDMYYTCGFSDVDSYGKECDSSWSLTKKSLSCEYVCQFEDYPILPMKHWYPSLYADDRGVDEANIAIPDPKAAAGCSESSSQQRRRRLQQRHFARAASKQSRRRSLSSADLSPPSYPDYTLLMDPSDPKYDLQKLWQEYHYCDAYSSFCSYSEVIRSIKVWSDTDDVVSEIPTRSNMVTPNITMLLGELPVKATVPPLDLDIFYSNLDILPDAPESPVFTKDRIAKARSHTLHKTLDWEVSFSADAYIAGPEGSEGTPTEGQLKDLQDSIDDFLSLNDMFIYARGSQNSEIEETCDLQKLLAVMPPMRIMMYSNLTQSLVCDASDNSDPISDSDPSPDEDQQTPAPSPSPSENSASPTPPTTECPYGACLKYTQIEEDPFYMTRIDLLSVTPPSVFALANFSLNLPFLVYGDIPTIVMDVNSGNDPFCVVEISPFRMENKVDEANPNIPTYAHVNLTMVDMRTFMDKMAAMKSFDEMELWISGSTTVGLDSPYFFSLISTMMRGFTLPLGSLIANATGTDEVPPPPSPAPTPPPPPDLPTFPKPFINVETDSTSEVLETSISMLLSESFFPSPVAFSTRDLTLTFQDDISQSTCGTFGIPSSVLLKAACSFSLDPYFCTYGGENYANMSLSISKDQGNSLRDMLEVVTSGSTSTYPVSVVDGQVTYPDHWYLNPTLLAASTVLDDCADEILSFCSSTSDTKAAISCLSEPSIRSAAQPSCLDALLPKGAISGTFDDMWDIPHALQMSKFDDKNRIPYTSVCDAPCPFSNRDHWYFIPEDDVGLMPDSSKPPPSSVNPAESPPFAVSAFKFNSFKTGDAPLDMDCMFESYEGLRTFKSSHCNGLGAMSLGFSVGIEAFIGMSSVTDDIDLDFVLNTLSAVIEYSDPSEFEDEEPVAPVLARMKLNGLKAINDLSRGLGGGVTNVTFTGYDIARLVEFVGEQNAETVQVYFDGTDEGDVLSNILALPAFTMTFKPGNGTRIAEFSSAELTIDYPLVMCPPSGFEGYECYILNSLDIQTTEDWGGELSDKTTVFAQNGDTLSIFGEGYYQLNSESGLNLFPGMMKVALRKIDLSFNPTSDDQTTKYDETYAGDFPVLCTSIDSLTSEFTTLFSTSSTTLNVLYPLPEGEKYVGLYDIYATVDNDYKGCNEPYDSASFSPSLDNIRLVSQVAVLSKPSESGSDNASPSSPSIPSIPATPPRNNSRPLSTLSFELNSTINSVGLFNQMTFDKFDASRKIDIPGLNLELINIPLEGVTPDVPEDITNAMDECQNNGGECGIMSFSQFPVYVDGINSLPTSGKILAIVADDGSTDLFNQVTNEGLRGKAVGLSLQGNAGDNPFVLKFVPFRIPQSARTFVDDTGGDGDGGGKGRRMLLQNLAAQRRRRISEKISEEDVFDAVSGFERLDPWLRNTSIYSKTEIALTGVELLTMSTLNTSFDTHYKDNDQLFLFYLETLTNVSTDIFQDLFTIEITLPDIAFETSLALEGYNYTDDDWHGLGEIDNSELPMTPFAELSMFGGTWSSNSQFALLRQSWMMINSTLFERGVGEFVSRNQNITFRAQGAPGGTTLLERMLRYVRFDYLLPARDVNMTKSNELGELRTVALPAAQTGGVIVQAVNLNPGTSVTPPNSRTVSSGTSIPVNGQFYRLEEAGCNNCIVQVHLGFVDNNGISKSDFICVYNGDPDEDGGQVYSFSESALSTPTEPGDYFLQAVVVFDYSCDKSFEVGAVEKAAGGKPVGSLRVESGGRRRLSLDPLPPPPLPCSQSKQITNGSSTFCIKSGDSWVSLSSPQPQPLKHFRTLEDLNGLNSRRSLNEEGTYKGTEGLRITGGMYSDENSIVINSTINVWPHIYANVPVDFVWGEMSLDFVDVARSSKLLSFNMEKIGMLAAVGGKVQWELAAKGEAEKASLTEFIEDLFDPTMSSRKIEVKVQGTMKGSLGVRHVDLGLIVSQADGRGYFDVQEQTLRRMLRTKMLEAIRKYLPIIPNLEEEYYYDDAYNPFEVTIDQQTDPLRSLVRILEEDEAADDAAKVSPYGGSIAKVDIIGGSSIGSPVRLPCVVEFACPPLSESKFEAATDVLLMAEYAFVIPGGLEVHFDIPEISLDVDCCVHTKLLSVTLNSDTISNADLDRPFIGTTKLEIDDAQLMYQSFTSIGTTFAPVYRIHGNPNGNMLSQIISTVEFKYDMTPNSGTAMMCKDETWVTYNEVECYKLFSSPRDQTSAQANCEAEGGHLLHIVDEDMNLWIVKEIFGESSSVDALIGLDDKLVPGVWRWIDDGSTGGYTNWDSTSLSDPGNCAVLNGNNLWSPVLCTDSFPYICEVDAIPFVAGTPSPTVSPAPTPVPTSLDNVCPALVPEGATSIAAANSWSTFFYPTKCQGTWRLSNTNEENAYFEIIWPGVALPVQVLLPTCSITIKYGGSEVATITPGSTSDLVFQNDGTTAFLKVHIYGDPALENQICMNQDYVEDKTKCKLAEMIDTLLKGAMETGGPLDLEILIQYDHPFEEYGTQSILMDISLFQEEVKLRPQPGESQESTLVEPTRAPTPADSYCNVKYDEIDSTEQLGSGVVVKREEYMGKCCNECVNDFVAIYNDISVDVGSTLSGSWTVLFGSGAEIYLSVEICNVFPFPIQASRLKTDASFMDQDGCQFSWIPGGTHEAKEDVPIASGVVWSDTVNPLIVPGGQCKFTPQIKIDVPVTTEVLARLLDEYQYKSRLCLTLNNMVVDMGLGTEEENDAVFKWTQPLDLQRISVVGFNDCVMVPSCENEVGIKVDQNFVAADWEQNSPGSEMKILSSSKFRLHDASGSQASSAYLKQQRNMLDDWQIDFTVKVAKTSWLGTNGGQFGIVAQNKGITTIPGSGAFAGLGSESLGVIFDVYEDDGRVFKNGGVETTNQIGLTEDVDEITSGQYNSYRLTYNAYHKVLAFYFNTGTSIVETKAPKMTIQEDLNSIFTTNLGYAWVGFVVKIGSGSWSQIDVSSFKFSSVKTSLAQSVIEEEKLTLPKAGTFVIDAKGSCGTFRFSGGDLWSVVLKNEAEGLQINVPQSSILDLGTGRYTVTYDITVAGEYEVWASLNNDFSGEDQGTAKIGTFTAS